MELVYGQTLCEGSRKKWICHRVRRLQFSLTIGCMVRRSRGLHSKLTSCVRHPRRATNNHIGLGGRPIERDTLNPGPTSSHNSNYSDDPDDGLNADGYLNGLNLDEFEIDWVRISPVTSRVFTRLVVDIDAFRAHLIRLENDGNRYFHSGDDWYRDGITGLVRSGPEFICVGFELDPLFIMRDGFALTAFASLVRKHPSPFWADALRALRGPFTTGDRDDVAAARLYVLIKSLP